MPRIVHFEIPADDPERSSQFFEAVFGWKIKKWEGPMEYWLVQTGPDQEPGIDGGLARRTDPAAGLELTIDVKNLDQVLKAVKNHGGKASQPKRSVPGVGWLAYIKDTEGNGFGVMESDREAA